MSSDEDTAALMAAFKKGAAKPKSNASPTQPEAQPSHHASSSKDESIIHIQTATTTRKLLCVRIPPATINRADYTYYEPKDEVEYIMREFSEGNGDMSYQVRLVGKQVKQVSSTLVIVSLIGKGGGCIGYHHTSADPTLSLLSHITILLSC